MCGCVPGEALRQCSAANPADIYVLSVRSLRRSSRTHKDVDMTTSYIHKGLCAVIA